MNENAHVCMDPNLFKYLKVLGKINDPSDALLARGKMNGDDKSHSRMGQNSLSAWKGRYFSCGCCVYFSVITPVFWLNGSRFSNLLEAVPPCRVESLGSMSREDGSAYFV